MAPFCGILERKGDVEMPETKFRCPYCGVEFIEKSDNTKIRTIDYGRDADELAITGYTWLDHEIQLVTTAAQRVRDIPFGLQDSTTLSH